MYASASSNPPIAKRRRQHGLTLAEAVVCLSIVSITIVAALSTVSAAKVTRIRFADRQLAQELARGLLAEIMNQTYEEAATTPAFGPEPGEADGSRRNFDDVDDYDGWTATPPENSDGTAKSGLSDWTELVTVERIGIADLSTDQATETGIKRITVEIELRGVTLARLVALRTDAWVDDVPE